MTANHFDLFHQFVEWLEFSIKGITVIPQIGEIKLKK